MAKVKIAIIGGGSYAWMPTILNDLALSPELAGSTIVLEDVDPEPLKVTGPLARKIFRTQKADLKVRATTDEAAALDGADFVVLTISTGGLDAMAHDLEIPARYGVVQSVGDTVGPGGLARGLRNIPVIERLAAHVEKRCPDAWVLNYTNPMSTLTRTFYNTSSVRAVGLCHEVYGTMHWLSRLFGVDDWRSEIRSVIGGVNHFVWILQLTVRGEDGFALLREYIDDPAGFQRRMSRRTGRKLDVSHATHGMSGPQLNLALFDGFGYLPVGGGRHLGEFFHYFLTERTEFGKRFGFGVTTIQDRREGWLPRAQANCRQILRGTKKLPARRSAEAASKLICALAGEGSFTDVMNLPNRGQIDNLPREAVVETWATADGGGIQPHSVGPLPKPVLTLVHKHAVNQEMIVEAALRGDRKLALAALLADPMTADFDDAKAMLDEMLAANRRHLPRFFPRRRK
jgi:alpha-galactosidase